MSLPSDKTWRVLVDPQLAYAFRVSQDRLPAAPSSDAKSFESNHRWDVPTDYAGKAPELDFSLAESSGESSHFHLPTCASLLMSTQLAPSAFYHPRLSTGQRKSQSLRSLISIGRQSKWRNQSSHLSEAKGRSPILACLARLQRVKERQLPSRIKIRRGYGSHATFPVCRIFPSSPETPPRRRARRLLPSSRHRPNLTTYTLSPEGRGRGRVQVRQECLQQAPRSDTTEMAALMDRRYGSRKIQSTSAMPRLPPMA